MPKLALASISLTLLVLAVDQPADAAQALPVTDPCGAAPWVGSPALIDLRLQLAGDGCNVVEALDVLVSQVGTADLERITGFIGTPLDAEAPEDTCRGEIILQHELQGNSWGCGFCVGNVIVQVGLDNSVDCPNGCVGNLVIQVGLGNGIECYASSADYVLEHAGVTVGTLPEQNFIVKMERPLAT